MTSSAFCLRRAVLHFRHSRIRASLVRAHYIRSEMLWLPLSYNFTMADLVLHDYVGIAQYHFYNVMGRNVIATKPGAL